jgi:cysteine-rich repeat protein
MMRGGLLILYFVVVHAACLQQASNACANGALCPPGRQCAEMGDQRICILASCGNGEVDDGELCDDGNNRSGDGCPADCAPPCGDGVRDPSEVCDDGNTMDGDECSYDCSIFDGVFLVSPTKVDFVANEGDPPPAGVIVIVRLEYEGAPVTVGFAPGVVQPSWISITDGPSTDTTASFILEATDTLVAGQHSTRVRFVIGRLNTPGKETFDLPVAYSVVPSDLALQATPAALSFAAAAGGAVPSSQTVSATFNGDELSVVSAPSWITITPSQLPPASPASFAVAVNSTSFGAGTVLSGDIAFRTTRGVVQRTSTVHVTYQLLAFVPEIWFVAPYVGVAGQAGTLRVRGRGFQTPSATIRVGNLDIGPVTPDGDTLVTISYPALPEGRYSVVPIDPVGISPTAAELVIVPPTPTSYHAIDAPGHRTRLIYDAERQALYGVSMLDQQIEHFTYASGAWSTVPPHIVPQLTDAAMAPNGRSLIVLDRDAINEMSLTDGQFALVRRVDNPDPSCGGFFEQAVPANNGKILVVFAMSECFGFTPIYLYDLLDHSLETRFSAHFALAAASDDGSRIYVGDSFWAPGSEQAVQIFNSLSNTVSSSTTDLNVTAMSVSGNASRVILQDRYVYSRSLTLTGNIPLRGVALASRDSSRAFVYVEDADGPRLEVYNLNGPLQSGALYPLLRTVTLPDSANGAGDAHSPVAMTSSPDDAVVFVSGDSKLLVVPVN